MPTLYSLDVAFDSDTEPADSNQPVVMAYGFAVELDGGTGGKGEGQTPRKIAQGSNFVFNVFDTSPNSTVDMVTKIEVVFGEGITPFVGADSKTPLGSPIVVNSPGGNTDQTSNGCNVTGVGWNTVTYAVLSDIPDGTPYECTITVTTKNNGTFSVDPEVIIDGGG